MQTTKDDEKQGMFWADQIARNLPSAPTGTHVIGDAKTPSGRVHVGSLRGVIIHDVIYKALVDAGVKAEFAYRFDDFDPMDSFPAYLPEKFKEYMGKPLCNIPSPEPGYDSFSHYYAIEFESVFEALDCHPKIIWTAKDYKAGLFDESIKTSLEKASLIKEINERVSGGKKQGDWLPIHVVCDECGRIGTTQSKDFDGKTVNYTCAGAKYATGCGHTGRKSPFKGGSKLTWKAQWAAQWMVYNVTVEGEGKDHAVVGGSRDVTNEISTKVFNYTPPFDMPYEFFLVGGKKMSSSKGTGSTAKEVSEVLPPELLRFLIVRYKPRTAINFSPEGETLPRLYDDFDTFGESLFGRRQSRDPDEQRIYSLSQVNGPANDYYRPQFSFLAYLMQVPHVKVREAVEKRAGRPLSQEEAGELERRLKTARTWLERYAGDEFKLTILDQQGANAHYVQAPAGVQQALSEFGDFFAETDAEKAQMEMIKALCQKHGIKEQEFYEYSYKILLGKAKGPRLLPFINSLERQFVAARFKGLV